MNQGHSFTDHMRINLVVQVHEEECNLPLSKKQSVSPLFTRYIIATH